MIPRKGFAECGGGCRIGIDCQSSTQLQEASHVSEVYDSKNIERR